MTSKSKSNELKISRVYDAPVQAVWDAWTDPEQVARWWGPRGFSITTHSKDLRPGGNLQGASTLSMQLAGSLWLDRSDRTWHRKIPEILMTLHMEHKLTKEEIFEHYTNQIYLGNVGSFSVNGFGEGAQSYFG